MGQSISTRKPRRPGPYLLRARDALQAVDQVDFKLKGATLATVDPNNTPGSTFTEVEVEASTPGDALPPAYKSSTHHHTEDKGYGSIDRVHQGATVIVSILKKDRVPSNEGTKDRDNGRHPPNMRRVRFHNSVQRFEYQRESPSAPWSAPTPHTRHSNTLQSDSSYNSGRMSTPRVYAYDVATMRL